MIISDEVFYLIAVRAGLDVGVLVFVPCDEDDFGDGLVVHSELGAECRGSSAAAAVRAAFAWIFENTNYADIFAEVPRKLRHVHVMARHAGMEFVGVEHNLRCYRMNKQDFRKAA